MAEEVKKTVAYAAVDDFINDELVFIFKIL